MNKFTRSSGQKKKLYIGALSTIVFLILSYIGFNFFHSIFEKSEEAITNFEILKTIIPYTLGASFSLFSVLAFLFGRESKKVLPKGFYTTKSWLDITHHNLAAIDKGQLIQFDFSKDMLKPVQQAYQAGTDLENIYKVGGSEEQIRIPLNEISSVESEHNSNDLMIEHNESSQRFVFMNPLVKKHALLSMKLMFPKTLQYTKIQKTRLQAILPSLFILLVLATIIYFLDGYIINSLLIGFGLIAIVPLLLKGLISPPEVEQWEMPEVENASGVLAETS